MQLPEIVATGLYDGRLALKKGEVTKNRKTTMFELEIPVEQGGISYMDGQAVQITENLIICAKPNSIRHTKLPFKCYFVHLIVNDDKLFTLLSSVPPYITVSNISPYLDTLKQLCALNESALEQDKIIVQSLLLKFIYQIASEGARQSVGKKSNGDDVIEKVIQYIKQNLTADLSLSGISRLTNFSPIHFHNRFKAATGRTLRDFVEGERIGKAVNLLISTDLTLTEIAFACGFSSQAYFSYAFKKRMKVTPRQYVKDFYGRYSK